MIETLEARDRPTEDARRGDQARRVRPPPKPTLAASRTERAIVGAAESDAKSIDEVCAACPRGPAERNTAPETTKRFC
jgi:hypothetical protein